MDAYKRLAQRLDTLPNGFPPTDDGVELQLLAALYTPDEADLTARLRYTLETPAQIAERIGGDPKTLRKTLKDLARRGLIRAGRAEKGMGYGLLPFVVGIYEAQVDRIDAEFAELFETYYRQAFGKAANMSPAVHRVIPVGESVRMNMEIRPFESVTDIVDEAKAWGVLDCICRKQKALINDPCEHPIEDTCMVFGPTTGMFDHSTTIRALSHEEALTILQRTAAAGLVHSVSNTQDDLWYICNCCTCSCGVLRGIAELGMANVVAKAPFISVVDDERCIGCEVCVEYCQFDALMLEEGVIAVSEQRCVGCGQCVMHCDEEALTLARRDDVASPPINHDDWMSKRAAARGLSLEDIL